MLEQLLSDGRKIATGGEARKIRGRWIVHIIFDAENEPKRGDVVVAWTGDGTAAVAGIIDDTVRTLTGPYGNGWGNFRLRKTARINFDAKDQN